MMTSYCKSVTRVPKRAIVVGVSVALVVLSFLAPQNAAAVLAGLGIAGLFAVRVSLMR